MRIVPALVILLATVAIAGCSKKVAPACPTGGKLADASTITVFRDGPGRDITDIEYKAQLLDVQGGCEYIFDENRMTMWFQAIFDIEPGPTTTSETFDIPYFIAITKKGNIVIEQEGFKESFVATVPVPETRASFRYRDGIVDVEMPLTDDINGRNIEIIFGFQLTEEQLRYNRAQIRR